MEAPLLSLTDEPIHLLSEESLRERVQSIRAKRQSHQTFRAAMQREAEEEEAKEPKAPKAKKKSAIADLFDSLPVEEAPSADLDNLFNSL
jgi:hypothetical protein